MEIKHRAMTPSVHPDAYVAPTAVLSGQVSVGAGSCVLHGAVLTADGGPVEVGANSVIMENAVLRGTDPAAGRGEQMRTAMRRYTAMLAREHGDDE
jgi:carbonic anhydrase/acetyltransferase-like protein (isoleucine patch superfamily)